SSHVDRFTSVDDSKHFNVELLIKNLINMIIKKLSMLYVNKSSISLSVSSAAFFSAAVSSSSTLISVSDSSVLTISVSVTSTLATFTLITSALSTASAFDISSPCFKKMLHRLDKSYFS
ncbi:hypothetical protein BDDG_13645, partial [Blastomyces dermatitidis ATCC 18188]